MVLRAEGSWGLLSSTCYQQEWECAMTDMQVYPMQVSEQIEINFWFLVLNVVCGIYLE